MWTILDAVLLDCLQAVTPYFLIPAIDLLYTVAVHIVRCYHSEFKSGLYPHVQLKKAISVH